VHARQLSGSAEPLPVPRSWKPQPSEHQQARQRDGDGLAECGKRISPPRY
jgi:hypothetical protein